MLVDLRPYGVTGKDAEESLGRANITCNKNGIPFDTESPMITSGIRLGTPAATTRGFKSQEFKLVGELITKVLKDFQKIQIIIQKSKKKFKKRLLISVLIFLYIVDKKIFYDLSFL